MDPRLAMLARQLLQGSLGQPAPSYKPIPPWQTGPQLPALGGPRPMPAFPPERPQTTSPVMAPMPQGVQTPAMPLPTPQAMPPMPPQGIAPQLNPVPPPIMPAQQGGPITSMAADFQSQGQPNLAPPPGQAQWQATVDAAKRRMGLGNMVNALGQLGTYVHTPQGVQKVAAVEGLGQGMIDQAQQDLDIMSPDERAYIKSQVPEADIPDGLTRTQFRTGPYGKVLQDTYGWNKFLIGEQNKDTRLDKTIDSRESISAANRNAADARSQRRLEIMERAQDLREQMLDLSTERLGFQRGEAQNRDARFWARLRMPNGEPYSRITDLTKAKITGRRFLETYDPANFGPIEGRLNQFLNFLGLTPEDYARDNAVRMQVNAQYLFGLGGKALTGTELAQLAPTLPQLNQNPAAFRQILNQLLTKIDSDLQLELEAQGRIGKDVTGLADLADVDLSEGAMSFMGRGPAAAPSATPAPAAPSCGTVLMYDSSGKPYDIPMEEVEQAKRDGLTTTRP